MTSRRPRLLVAVLCLGLLGATPSPDPTPVPPIFELHRTAEAAHLDPTSANPLFILVIGSDVREGDPVAGRADSLHVVAVNTQTGRGTVIGIPRDAYVPIPGHGTNKINASLFFGGAEGVVRTVSELSGLPIHYWALTEFSRFRQLVDTLGGIDVEVPYPMYDRFSGSAFDPGPRHMNGAEALAFSRARKGIPGGDFGRSENHGRLLLAALSKFKTEVTDPFALYRYLDAFDRLVATDVPVTDLIHLGLVARRLDPAGFENLVLPGGTGNAGAASVVFLGPETRSIFDAVRDDGVR